MSADRNQWRKMLRALLCRPLGHDWHQVVSGYWRCWRCKVTRAGSEP